MDVSVVLSRLAGVRKTQKGWTAKCPAHQDRSPSLMVSVRSDNSIGVHCFGGCATSDVVAAIGLAMSDLFADNRNEPGYRPPVRHALTHADVLRCLSQELGVAAQLAIAIADLDPLDEPKLQRGLLAVGRITTALEFVEHGQ